MIDAVFTLAQVMFTAGLAWSCYHLGRRAERRAGPPPPAPLEAVCSCGHGYGKHPGNGEHCGGVTTVRTGEQDYHGRRRWKDEHLECSCVHYDGPDPETVRMIRGA